MRLDIFPARRERARLERIVKLMAWRIDEESFPHAFAICACDMCEEIRKWREEARKWRAERPWKGPA